MGRAVGISFGTGAGLKKAGVPNFSALKSYKFRFPPQVGVFTDALMNVN
jgi:hypothetical protein